MTNVKTHANPSTVRVMAAMRLGIGIVAYRKVTLIERKLQNVLGFDAFVEAERRRTKNCPVS